MTIRLFLRRTEARFFAGDEALDICAMFEMTSTTMISVPKRDDFRRRVAGRVEEVNKKRERGCGGDGAERGIAPENHHQQPQSDSGSDRLPADRQENAEAGGDSFAALETEPHREHVADDGEDSGDHHPANIAACEMRLASQTAR